AARPVFPAAFTPPPLAAGPPAALPAAAPLPPLGFSPKAPPAPLPAFIPAWPPTPEVPPEPSRGASSEAFPQASTRTKAERVGAREGSREGRDRRFILSVVFRVLRARRAVEQSSSVEGSVHSIHALRGKFSQGVRASLADPHTPAAGGDVSAARPPESLTPRGAAS